MAALVQTYPQQSGTVTLLHTRTTSASGIMAGGQGQNGQQYGHGASQRGGSHGTPMGGPVYRSNTAPIQPYAFTSTPSLTSSQQWQQFRASRTASASALPTAQTFDYNQQPRRVLYPASASMTNLPSSTQLFGPQSVGVRDDSVLPAHGTRRVASTPRPQSAHLQATSSQALSAPVSAKASPERYRRPSARSAGSFSSGSDQQPASHGQPSMSSSSAVTAMGQNYNATMGLGQIPHLRPQPYALVNRPNSYVGAHPTSIDDMQLYRDPSLEDLKRFRRRSMPALDSAGFPKSLAPPDRKQPDESVRLEQSGAKTTDKEPKPAHLAVKNDHPVHARSGSADSRGSSRSTTSTSRPSSSANRNANVSTPTGNPASLSSAAEQNGTPQDYPRLVTIPPRSSSSDAATTKRVINPSPLSKPVTMDSDAEQAKASGAVSPSKVAPRPESPAVKQLAAINQKGKLRSKTSRLRRAFSFGSAAEFKNATTPEQDAAKDASANADADAPGAGPSKLHKEPSSEEIYDAEQARIAQQQEEAGLGNSIYSGKLFAGSTDNISISSTASSASIMIRKMGRGMKKGTRSLVGLFRPKSIIGVPAADAKLPEASQATVSMVTVEAEQTRVNVNADPHSQAGGGTGFPRLERNSIDASRAASASSERLGSSGTDNSGPRKSIVGGEKERAEVLAAVRKGILKHTNGSPNQSPRPSDVKGPTFELPNVPNISESPISSAPSTPNEEMQGHRRTGSVAIGSEDYFMSALRLRQDTKSAPATPQGTLKRNATFSPRIVFYDTWPSQEYDRRGEIATCNRLTPMLAQQIKEELNNFKMEMEVHENSKIYTHFF
ncbi:hypothetical protein GQ53DRAFT_523386 [Thozetella sp. PMI_491]|nr:hypothetical protein GQ53DRAFT_523386 [Thozetella sp. PMI_491]